VQRDLKVFDEPGTKHIGVAASSRTSGRSALEHHARPRAALGVLTPLQGIAGKGALANYDPATHTIAVAGYGDVDEALNVEKDFTHFAPRTGSSWRSDEKSVVRAATARARFRSPTTASRSTTR
jgi:hypothetical protein